VVEAIYWRVSNALDVLVNGKNCTLERGNEQLFEAALENLLKLRKIEETLKK
jgi:hypothetical protein